MTRRTHHTIRLCLLCLLALTACTSGGLNSPFSSNTGSPVHAGDFPAAPRHWQAAGAADNFFKTPQEVDTWVESTLAEMSLRQKIGQMILTGVVEETIKERTCENIQMLRPGGVTFQSGNIRNPDQLRIFTAELEKCSQAVNAVPMLLTLAHEGESTRFVEGVTAFPSALALGAVGDPGVAYQTALASGQELRYSGINMILGPVADVLVNPRNEVIHDRAFGSDPTQVARYVEQAATGYIESGLIPVLKHFPGHGGVSEDSHVTLPVDQADRQKISTVYLPPFRSGLTAGTPVIMLSHIAYPALSGSTTPATLSPQLIRFLRKEMEFNGLILSDSMRMKAVNTDESSVEEASLQAVQAGVDMLLLNEPSQARLTRNYLHQAVLDGKLSEDRVDEAVRRILTLKAIWGIVPYQELQLPEPDWQAHARLLDNIGQRIPAVLKDEYGYVPLPAEARRIRMVAPQRGWDFYSQLEAALKDQGRTVEAVFYSPPWEGPDADRDLLDTLLTASSQVDLTLVVTWHAYLREANSGLSWQAELVRGFLDQNHPLVVIALNTPTDLLAFPDVPAFVDMYGTTPGQWQAVIQALTGERQLVGSNPLPGVLP